MSYLPADLRERLVEADYRHCAYCYTTTANTGQPMTVDHMVPQAQGGETTFENLMKSSNEKEESSEIRCTKPTHPES